MEQTFRRSVRSAQRLGAAGLALALPAGAQATDPLPRRDSTFQVQVRALLAAQSEEQQRAALQALRAWGETRALVQQLFLFSQAASDTREALLLGFVLAELRIPPLEVVQALVPLLESEDAALRAGVAGVLSEYEQRSVERGADFSIYRALLEEPRGRGAEPAAGLVRHLFEVDPGAALLLCARVELTDPAELRPILWAEHTLADLLWKQRHGFLARDVLEPAAVAELQGLLRHPRWWARLYALRLLRLQPAFLRELSPAPLLEDPHALVREFAAAAAAARPR